MGKDKRSGGKAPRHDPLHAELADTPDQGMRRKTTRQKFVDRNQQDQVEEVNLEEKKKLLEILGVIQFVRIIAKRFKTIRKE